MASLASLRGSSSRFRQAECALPRTAPAVSRRPCRAVPKQSLTRRVGASLAQASLKVQEEATGVSFSVAQKFWEGETFRCLGAGHRMKKILFVNVQIYAVGAYVEADKAAKELAIRARGGFFETDQDYCDAIMDGAFNKVLVVHLVRDIEGQQFTDALEKYLVPRLQLAGELDKLEEFKVPFIGKQLGKDTEVVLFWNTVGDMEVLVAPASTSEHEYDKVKPSVRVRSVALCRGLFEVFFGSNSVVEEAKPRWVEGAKQLMDSEVVKRATRKAGG